MRSGGALRWSRAAAEESFERLAYEEAANWYQRAVDVLDAGLRVLEPGPLQQCRTALIAAVVHLAIDHQRQSLLEGKHRREDY